MMAETFKLRKGYDIKLLGEAEKIYGNAPKAETYVIKPTDFKGVVPKLLVQEGDLVKAGDPLFFDKKREDLIFTSPVSGEVIEINRGDKRRLEEIKILADKDISYTDFEKSDPIHLSRKEVIDKLMKSGCWPFIRQRPFSIIANPEHKPKGIFISAFDSSPLAPDNSFILKDFKKEFQTGLDALFKICPSVHLNIDAEWKENSFFKNLKNIKLNTFSGPHPSGNVGIQIHHINPINKGEVTWYIYTQEVIQIGKLFLEGFFDASRIIAITGSEVKDRKYHKTYIGTAIKPYIKNNVEEGKLRFISGNVLTGNKISPEGYLGFYDKQITVIPEGDQPEFLGWLSPGIQKLSLSRTFLSWLWPNKKYRLDTNLHGEPRPFVITWQYENLLPMNIFPLQLMKAILIKDIDLMENLGIYEVDPEDFALCEFVCPSKTDCQEIIRQGQDLMLEEEGILS